VRGRGWNPRTLEVGEAILSDDEEVNENLDEENEGEGPSEGEILNVGRQL
jgi:hypothetical protein